MEDKARRFIVLIQDPEGYPAYIPGETSAPSIPVTARTAVLEDEYKEVFDRMVAAEAMVKWWKDQAAPGL